MMSESMWVGREGAVEGLFRITEAQAQSRAPRFCDLGKCYEDMICAAELRIRSAMPCDFRCSCGAGSSRCSSRLTLPCPQLRSSDSLTRTF